MTSKLIYDNIWGYTKIDGRALKILDTPEFQRLRNIKQLGTCHYVWPSAVHTRFSHSIGVYHLADDLIQSIKTNQPELNITNNDAELIKISSLTHDIGHGPLSHIFDNYIVADPTKNHEFRSGCIIEYLIKKYNIEINPDELNIIKMMINPPPNQHHDLGWKFQIISGVEGSLDIDKFDYIARDLYHVGIKSSCDYSRLIKQCRVIDNQICYPVKEIFNIYEILRERYRLFRQIYTHHAVCSIEHMIRDALISAEQVLHIKKSIMQPEHFCKLTDYILEKIKESPELKQARKILNRIERRDLYKLVGETIIHSTIDKAKIGFNKAEFDFNKAEFNFSFSLNEMTDDVIVQCITVGYANKNGNPVDNIWFYSSKNPNCKFKVVKSAVSHLIPNQFQETILRVYYKHESSKNYAQKLFSFLKLQN